MPYPLDAIQGHFVGGNSYNHLIQCPSQCRNLVQRSGIPQTPGHASAPLSRVGSYSLEHGLLFVIGFLALRDLKAVCLGVNSYRCISTK